MGHKVVLIYGVEVFVTLLNIYFHAKINKFKLYFKFELLFLTMEEQQAEQYKSIYVLISVSQQK